MTQEIEIIPMCDPRGYMTIEEAERIVFGGCPSSRDKTLFATLLYTGRRVSEVVGRWGITPNDIDSEKDILSFVILKRKRKDKEKSPEKRPFPAPRKLVDMLLTYITEYHIKPEAKIFPISRHRVYQLLRSAGNRVGIFKVGEKKLHPHHFRHTFAVHMANTIQNPAGLKMVQDMLAHSSISVTTFYLRFNPIEQKNLLEKAFGEKHE